MAQRKSRSRRQKSSKMRGFGCVVIILLVICSLFLVTCRKQQNSGISTYRQPATSHSHTRLLRNDTHHPDSTSTDTTQHQDNTSNRITPATPSVNKSVTANPPPPVVDNSNTTQTSDDREFSRGDSTQKRIAITFDAGASAKPAAQILKVLAKHNLKCTFFLTGKWMEQNRSVTQQIADAGHEIGNHSYSHRRFTDLSDSEIAVEADKTDHLAIEITDHSTKPLFRCPFGARDKRVLKALADQGYKSIYWDVDSWDSVKKDITAKQIEDRVLEKVRNGSVILMHCGSQPTADALDSLLTKLEAAGYEPVTISQLAGLQ